MLGVHQTLDGICQTIRDNIQSDENKAVFLTQKEAEYMACLEMKHRDLEMLFRQDEAQWTDNLEVTNREAHNIKERIKELLAKHS